MLFISEKELKMKLESEYWRGIEHGIKIMEERLLLASENGNPLDIEGRACFLKSDMENLQAIFEDLESEE